jgi:bifunctional non-homologous end joining protein LigD
MKDVITIGRYTIEVSHPEKLYFPKSKITKGELIDYYAQISPLILTHVKNHPLTMQRFPEGITGESFYQKNISSYFPSWITRKNIPSQEKETVEYVVADKPATFVYLANQGCITMHAWLSKVDKLDYPDRIVFDLDPSVDNFSAVRHAALQLKDILDAMHIPSFAMTTGSRGIHVTIPLKRVHTFDEIAEFCTAVGHTMVQDDPKRYTMELRKEKRGNKIFVDTLRNRWSATSVVPYCARPKEKAPVATPLYWDEVTDSKLTAQKYTIKTVFDHVKSEGDPWKDFYEKSISLKKIIKGLQ